MKRIFTGLFLFLLASTVQTQTIVGTVRNGQAKPIENATVALFSQGDSTYVEGTSTDASGRFSLQSGGLDTCLVRVGHLGYETVWLKPEAKMRITLAERSIAVEAAVVKAKRPLYSKKDGTLYANIAGTRLANEPSALHILGRLPGMYRTGNKLNTFMSGAVLAYVDHELVSEERLMQIDVKTIDRVEVIHTPGAEYPAGTAMVLKVQTRRILGLSTYLSAYGEQTRKFSTGGNVKVQYRQGAWTFYTIARYSRQHHRFGQEYDVQTRDWTETSEWWGENRTRSIDGTAGLAYSPSEATY